MLAHVFDAELIYRSEMEPLTLDGEGELIGSGDGSVAGDAIAGVLAWTLSSGRASSKRPRSRSPPQAEQVARRLRLRAFLAERFPQLGHVDLERLLGRLRRFIVSELVDQTIGGDDLVRVKQEDRGQCAVLRSAQIHRSLLVEHLQVAEDPELYGRPLARSGATLAWTPPVS